MSGTRVTRASCSTGAAKEMFKGNWQRMQSASVSSTLGIPQSQRRRFVDSPHGATFSPCVTVILPWFGDSPGRILASFFVASTVTAPGAGDSFEAFQPLRSVWAQLRYPLNTSNLNSLNISTVPVEDHQLTSSPKIDVEWCRYLR